MIQRMLALLCVALLAAGAHAADATNLLKNGSLSLTPETGDIEGWYADDEPKMQITEGLPEGAAKGVQLTITKAEKQPGFIGQYLKLQGDAAAEKYCVTGHLKSTKKGIAYLQVKLFKGREQLAIKDLAYSDTAWKAVNVVIERGEADAIHLMCRYKREGHLGETVSFAEMSLAPVAPETAK